MYYITDDCNYRMRDSKDEIFTCATLDECDDVVSFYFDMNYGDVFLVYDANDDWARTYQHDYETCDTEIVEG